MSSQATMRSFRRLLLPLALLLASSACHGWQGRAVPGPAAEPPPSPARVTLTDRSSVVVWHANVEGDSLIGLVGERSGERTRFAVSLAQVRRVDARGVDVEAVVAVLAAATLAVFAALLPALVGEW